jgi:hypothetical protein
LGFATVLGGKKRPTSSTVIETEREINITKTGQELFYRYLSQERKKQQLERKTEESNLWKKLKKENK